MDGSTTQNVMFVVGLVSAGVAFIGLVLGANALLSPRNPTPAKEEPYECGMPQAGSPYAPVRLRFATVAMLFVLFDAEAILLFAVVPSLHGSWIALAEVGAFTAFLALGLVYAWRKGALQWRW
ncbi:MAG: NADH-quinone oxidoreductase subunit A [Actinomycetota bacterium]|nr:NADH-quinone oxidoreductase subunit A [Actinomycetota bacterium]